MRHVLVLVATLLAGSTVCTLAGERVTNPRAVVVRGMNAASSRVPLCEFFVFFF